MASSKLNICTFLNNPRQLVAGLNKFIAETEIPHHYEDPVAYVEVMDYVNTVRDFKTFIENGIDSLSNSNQEKATEDQAAEKSDKPAKV